MNTNTTFTINLTLDREDANLLGTCGSAVFVRSQPCRFEPVGDGDHLALTWQAGSMTWCMSVAEALILRAYERASGFEAMILWDLAVAETAPDQTDAWVVLSTRPFLHT